MGSIEKNELYQKNGYTERAGFHWGEWLLLKGMAYTNRNG